MSNQIRYRAGQKQIFVATRSFSLGSSGITIPEGGELEFDGTAVSYAGLAPTVMPQLRGAIRAGWVVLADQYDPNDHSASIPQPAGMTMRDADGGNPMDPKPRRPVNMTIEEEEREVTNVADHARATREGNKENYRRKRTPRAESTAGQRFDGYAVEPQDGVEVPGSGFQTKAGKEARDTSTDITHAGAAIAAANKVKVRPGRGRTREELIRDAISRGGLTKDELLEYQDELDASRAVHGYEAPQVVRQLAPPQNQQREGFDVNLSVGGGVEIADLGGTGQTGEIETVVEEGMKFTRTASPKKRQPTTRVVDKAEAAPSNGAADALCRRIATAICKDFPDNYVFTDPPRKKIARLQADYDDRPDIIRAVCAAETDMAVKARLVEEFPEAF